MKRTLACPNGLATLVVLLAFALTACETPTGALDEGDEGLSDVEELSTALTQELSLSADQQGQLAAITHGRDGEAREPGFLWTLAAELQTTLTDEQKQRLYDLLARAEDKGVPGFGSPGGDRGFGGPGFGHKPRGDRGDQAGDLFGDLLTDEQRTQIDELRATYKEQFDALIEAHRNGDLSREDFKAQAEALREALKADIDALLTDEQRTEIENRMAERRAAIEAEMAERKAAEVAAMKEALALSEDQSAAIDALLADLEANIKSLVEQLKNGDIDKETFQAAMQEQKTNRDETLQSILDATQWEIVLIHDALEIRARFLKNRRGGPGGPGGDRQGPGGQRGGPSRGGNGG